MSSVDLTRTLSAPRRHRERPRARHAREAALSITALAVVLGVGFMLIKTQAPAQQSRAAERTGDSEMTTATIRLAPDRHDRCRQMMFDNRTGSFRDAGATFCGTPAASPASSASVDGHISQIREGFRGR